MLYYILEIPFYASYLTFNIFPLFKQMWGKYSWLLNNVKVETPTPHSPTLPLKTRYCCLSKELINDSSKGRKLNQFEQNQNSNPSSLDFTYYDL